jgi:GNAT superfamily N-acetyltransferase
MPAVEIRPAVPVDLPLILDLIKQLAEYERLAHMVTAEVRLLETALFGPRPYAEVIIAEIESGPGGFALFFHNFSTFLCKPGIYLEDLFVVPEARGLGAGKALMRALARIACERGCARFEWAVLDWNEPSIQFYRGLGAEPMDDWTVQRLSGEALREFADG